MLEASDGRTNEALADQQMAGVSQVRLLVPDMFGVLRSKTVAVHALEGMAESGHGWASPLLAADLWQNVPDDALEELGTGNIKIVPQMESLTRLPWSPSTAVVLCDLVRPGGVAAPSPRSALARVLADVDDLGYELKIGAELEFFVYEGGPSGPPPFGMNEWFTSQAVDKIDGFVGDLHRYLPEMGLPLYEVFNEHAAGQMEINFHPSIGMQALDNLALTKLAIREVAARHNLHATVMCKPRNDPGCATSGLHIHQVLQRDGENAFAAPDHPTGLSDVARTYIAGQLEHAAGLTAFAAPTVNSYKRFRPDTWAPVRAAWGVDNRTAMVRAIFEGDNTRIENRIGASDANGYLLVAAQAAAGLHGVREKLEATAPAEHNVLDDPSYEKVPLNLLDAIRALSQDTVLREALGEEFCRYYISVQEMVWDRFLSHVSDWEIQEYAGVL